MFLCQKGRQKSVKSFQNADKFGTFWHAREREREREREENGGCWARTRLDKHRGKLRAVDLNRFDPFNDATSEIYGAANRNVNPDMKWGPRERDKRRAAAA